jgi:MFS family permease
MNVSDQIALDLPTNRNVRAARIAVAMIFATNSLVLTGWFARIPDVKARLGLSEGTLGLALLCMAAGALVAQPTVGWLLGRISSRQLTTGAGLLFCLAMLLPAAAQEYWQLLPALFVLGAFNGGLDVAMNAQATHVEQQHGRPIMNSFHGLWSIGGLIGSILGGLAAAQGLTIINHFLIASVAGLVIIAISARWLWPDTPQAGEAGPSFALPPRVLLTMGLIAFAVLFCEGAIADWSAVYLRDTLSSGPALAAAGYSAFALLMAIGRLTGDRLAERFGAQTIIRGGGALVIIGMSLALLSSTPVLAIIGFASVGAGVACSFPLLISMAARTPGIAPGTAIAGIATAGYTGFLVGPPLIGLLAELTSLGAALSALIVAGVITVVLTGTLRQVEG